jgi:hypothetical protein
VLFVMLPARKHYIGGKLNRTPHIAGLRPACPGCLVARCVDPILPCRFEALRACSTSWSQQLRPSH